MKVILIPTVPGRFKVEDNSINKIGIGKVKHIMKNYSKNKQINPTLTYNSTSLGKLDENFIRQLYFAFAPFSNKF